MLAVALALVSAVSFGASDYAAGLATRAAGVLQVTFLAQVTSLTVALLVAPWVSPLRLSAAAAGWSAAAATGATGAAGTIMFFLASHHGLLAVTAVITSLYPGGTILLARIRPGERLSPVRLAGLALAGASAALIAVAGAR
jgi:drug/metabolite transporter (DMT)-like permease